MRGHRGGSGRRFSWAFQLAPTSVVVTSRQFVATRWNILLNPFTVRLIRAQRHYQGYAILSRPTSTPMQHMMFDKENVCHHTHSTGSAFPAKHCELGSSSLLSRSGCLG